MTAEKLTAEKTIFWLKKTLATISKMPQIRSFESNYRASELAIRYDTLKGRARDLGIWKTFCEQNGFCSTHSGYDLFA